MRQLLEDGEAKLEELSKNSKPRHATIKASQLAKHTASPGSTCLSERKSLMLKNTFATMILLALSAAASLSANPVPFKLTDSGDLVFTSQTSANLVGTGIASHGGKGVSAGVINITGPASCQGGFSAKSKGLLPSLVAARSSTPSINNSVQRHLPASSLASAHLELRAARVSTPTPAAVAASMA